MKTEKRFYKLLYYNIVPLRGNPQYYYTLWSNVAILKISDVSVGTVKSHSTEKHEVMSPKATYI